jgi:peroxiredoxin
MPVPRVGEPAPSLKLPGHNDEEFDLGSMRGKNVVVAFYPLAWTPV